MTTRHDVIDYVLEKLNTRAASMLCAFVLICGGIYMCFEGLNTTGSIGVKAAVVEGKIETGSLGLLAMFLGVVIVLAVNLCKPYGDQKIKLVINGKEITGTGLSYRKMRELVQAATSNIAEAQSKHPPDTTVERDAPQAARPSP